MVEPGSLCDKIYILPLIVLVWLNIINRRDICRINLYLISLFDVYVQSGSVKTGISSAIGFLSYDIQIFGYCSLVPRSSNDSQAHLKFCFAKGACSLLNHVLTQPDSKCLAAV